MSEVKNNWSMREKILFSLREKSGEMKEKNWNEASTVKHEADSKDLK